MEKCDVFNREDKHRNNECELCDYCYSQGNFGEQKEAFSVAINVLEKQKKIKVASAEIVVHGTSEKPYYEIRYYDISDGKYHIGYSSHDLSIVFGWLKECFEIVQEVAEKYNGGWIACSERLPEDGMFVLVQDFFEYYEIGKCEKRNGVIGITNGDWWTSANNYIAWQPLPEPFKEQAMKSI